MLEQCLILRRHMPRSEKVSALTVSRGKIFLIADAPRVSASWWPGYIVGGMLVSARNGYYRLGDAHLLFEPCTNADLLMISHELFELCYYLAPIEDPIPEVFQALIWLHKYGVVALLTSHERAVFCAWFFAYTVAHLGYYPPESLARGVRMIAYITSIDVDFSGNARIESIRKMLAYNAAVPVAHVRDWVRECLTRHPNCSSFKALRGWV